MRLIEFLMIDYDTIYEIYSFGGKHLILGIGYSYD